MNNLTSKVPVQVPEGYEPYDIFYVNIPPSYLTALFTGGNFYENFIDHHNIDLKEERSCPACGSMHFSKVSQDKIQVNPKMWASFNWGFYVRCDNCDCIRNLVPPPEKLLEFLYTYCYPNNQNKNPRFFTAFGLDEGEISGNIIDIGGGSGDLRDFCEGKYTNIDIRSSADICLDINEELKSKQIETLMTDKRKNTVVCCDLIEHVLKPQNIFKIANAVLVQGGKFYLNVGQFHTDENIGPFHPPHITSFSKKTIENLCDNFGFAVKRQDTNSFTLEKT